MHSVSNHQRGIGATLWEATSVPGPKLGPLEGAHQADVVVIGAGVAGLATALHLAKAGCAVAVVEAEAPGSGAAGNSGGLIAPDFIRHSPAEIEQLFGVERGRRLVQMVGSAARQCFDMIEADNISCDANRGGFFTPAHNEALAAALQSRAAEWAGRGFNVTYTGAEETALTLGSPRYCGAIRFADGGSINPLAFCRGMAAAALKHGASIYSHSPVRKLERHLDGWRVTTDKGHIDAKRVVLAANGGNSALHPALRQTVLPLSVYEYATMPLKAYERASILPGDPAFTDKQPYMFTARYDREGRLIAAFPNMFIKRREKSLLAEAEHRLKQHFPQLHDVSIDYLWQGTAWLDPSLLPKVYDLDDGAFAIQACNGRGLANNMVLGKEMAAMLTGGGLDALSVTPEAPVPVKWHPVAQIVPSLMMMMAYLRRPAR